MTGFGRDVRDGFRTLRKAPGFAAVAIMTLALGMGMTTAIFSVVDAVLLRPVPLADIDRLVMIWETDRASGTTHEPASLPDFLDFKQRSRRVGEFAAIRAGETNLTADEGEPSRIATLNVTDRFFPMLGIVPTVGRTFTPEEDRPGGGSAILISDALWQRQFQRDSRVVGRTLRLNDRPRTIIGVMPASADFGILQVLRSADYGRGFAQRDARTTVDVFAPLQGDPKSLPRNTHPIIVLGRLAAGASLESAQQELGAIAADLEETYPVNEARGVFVQPIRDVILGPIEPALFVLLAAVGVVLLIACVNVAHLLLARGMVRAREIAVRKALGAGLGRLARQFVVENTVLILVAAALGVFVASVALRVVLIAAPPDIPRLADVTIDARVLGGVIAISLAIGFVFGLIPLFQSRRGDLQTALKSDVGRGGTGGRESASARSVLMVAEIALAVVLVIGAGLLIKSFWHLQQVNPGFDASSVVKAEFQLPPTRYPTNFKVFPNFKEMQQFYARLEAHASILPGVEAVAIAGNHPLDAGFTNSFAVVGREAESRDWPEISLRRVSPGYFRVLHIPLVRGRLFVDSDHPQAPQVAIINEETVRRFFASQDPIGQQLLMYGAPRTIVGVIGDEKIHGLTEAAPIAVYMPLAQAPWSSATLMARISGDPLLVAGSLRAAVREIDPALAVFGVEPLERTLAQSTGEQRFMMLLVGVFAGLALALAVIGIHGVLSYSVVQRRREIGIRVALGAEPAQVVRVVLGQGVRLTAIGLAVGVGLALMFSRSLAGLLFGITATDAATFAAVVALLAAVAMLAMWLPARRASRVDPLVALRYE
jgi:putative ABC transport system permease protein